MNYHRDLWCVCSPVWMGAHAGRQARPKVKTKWPMNVRGEDLSQAPPALRRELPCVPSLVRLYIRCPHADVNHIANHTERAFSGISCWGISLSSSATGPLLGQPLTEFQAIIIGWRANMRKVFAFVFRVRLWYGMELIKFSAESVKFHCCPERTKTSPASCICVLVSRRTPP